MGIKRKIILGLISIGVLLLLSGMISTAELVRFKRATSEIMEGNKVNVELTKMMLDAAQIQNTYLLKKISAKQPHSYEEIADGRAKFEEALEIATEKFENSPILDNLKATNDEYNNIISAINDSTTVEWFSEIYKPVYNNRTNAIKDFMLGEQQNLISQTSKLETQAYRATMIGIIALAGGILLLIMFYYMLNHYMVSPVIAIQKSLHRHLNMHIPFDVSVATNDEMETLRNDINRVIEKSKK